MVQKKFDSGWCDWSVDVFDAINIQCSTSTKFDGAKVCDAIYIKQ